MPAPKIQMPKRQTAVSAIVERKQQMNKGGFLCKGRGIAIKIRNTD